MEQSEKNGMKSAFYYIPEQTDSVLDPGMPLTHPQVVDQWIRIAERGHEIGVHPGYMTYDESIKISAGVKLVRNQLESLGIEQDQLGGRQHYLRWKTPETAVALDVAGMDYDSTLGFADHAGFRCGLCYEFPMYDLINRKPLKIRQRPLVLMDCTVIDNRYQGMGDGAEAFDYMIGLKNECRKYDGDFTVLWHNQRFVNITEMELYSELIRA